MTKDVLYITIDSIRADRVGYLGYSEETTPEIDQLAADGTTFEQAIANGIPTYYSFKSLLGGIHSLSHSRSIGLPETATSIAEVFSDAGYDTAGFNAQNPWLTPRYGYNRGFDTFEDFMGNSESGLGLGQLTREAKRTAKRAVGFSDTLTDKLGQLGRVVSAIVGSQPLTQAEVVTKAAIDWIESRSQDRPFFLWIHYMDPHYPWVPPEKFLDQDEDSLSRIDVGRLWHIVAYQYQQETAVVDKQMMRQINRLYDAEIRRMDASIGELLESVDAVSSTGRPLIALAGDHGTELNDHGGFSHGPTDLYQEVVRVPLLFAGPDVPDDERELGALVDVPQTLVQQSNAVEEQIDTFEGINLLNEQRGSVSTEVVYDIDPVKGTNIDNGILRAHTAPPWKLVRNEETENVALYNLTSDNTEQTNLATEQQQRVSELTNSLEEHRKRIERRNRTIEEKQRVRRIISELSDDGSV
jgi:arylsulfatase A-like enzyme